MDFREKLDNLKVNFLTQKEMELIKWGKKAGEKKELWYLRKDACKS
jgi:hypothetical protein